MSKQQAKESPVDSVESRYRNNFPRYVLEVSRHLQTQMMDTLQQACGHKHLRLGFAPYITLIGEQTCRPTELAEILGISRQACNQAIRQIEAAGYIIQTTDPADGRARLLALSPQGLKLRRDGVTVVQQLDRKMAAIVSRRAAEEAAASIATLTDALGLSAPPLGDNAHVYRGLGGFLPRLSDYIYQRLMALTQARGHPGLKLSFGQVLPHIGPNGGRIQRIALMQDVSKQAISAIVAEIEALGYITRTPDPDDARQVELHFTKKGKALLRDSVASVSDLQKEFTAILGGAAMAQLESTLQQLFEGLGLETHTPEQLDAVDISLLAQQLREQLGRQRSVALGKLLITTTRKQR